MADKVEAKLFVQKLGIPVLPFVVVRPGEDLSQAAQGLGYPLLVKACVGGGGRGIRRVETSNEDLLGLAASASTEASWAFGESSFFLERLLRPARHLEVQIFGDGRGGYGILVSVSALYSAGIKKFGKKLLHPRSGKKPEHYCWTLR